MNSVLPARRRPPGAAPGSRRGASAARRRRGAGRAPPSRARGHALELRRRAAGRVQLGRTSRELDELGARQGFAEEHARRLRKLVRLVEDHRVACRQQLRDSFLAQHEIGEEEMVVDHDHVRGEARSCARASRSILEVRAALAEAVVARGRGVGPRRASSGTSPSPARSPVAVSPREALDLADLHRFLAGGRPPFARRAPAGGKGTHSWRVPSGARCSPDASAARTAGRSRSKAGPAGSWCRSTR